MLENGILKVIGGWITKALGATAFGSGIMLAFQSLLAGGKYSLIGTLGEMFTNPGAITAAGSWGSMIGFAIVKGLVGVLSIALGGSMLADAVNDGLDTGAYNIGLKEAGGKDSDKKGVGLGSTLKGALGGAAIGFGVGQIIPVIGPAVGAAIGAVAGAITTILSPAFEQLEVDARNANNEMQRISYYEGQVKGAQTQVGVLDELTKILNQTLQEQTDKVYKQGAELGITRTRMDELVTATQNGSFTTDMLTTSELSLSDSLTGLMTQQGKVNEATERLTKAKNKLLKAETDLAIAQDIEAGNYELAAARIELAEAQEVYSTTEATEKRIQLFKMAGDEEKKNLLQDLSEDQRRRMFDFNEMTDKELNSLAQSWQETSDSIKEDCLGMFDKDMQDKISGQLNSIDAIINSHKGFWQGVGDTLLEALGLIVPGWNPDTWTYNSGNKAIAQIQSDIDAGKSNLYSKDMLEELKKKGLIHYALGTNYVPSDGLAYLHQGEAVIPKKYNQPYNNGMSNEERAYMQQMMATMRSLDSTMQRGISINGEFRQRGSDLVAIVNKTKSQTGSDLLSNVAYAR